jgi:hypothetical protein
LLVLRRHGYGPPPVHYLGKTGTFVLLGAFPVLLLADAVPAWAPVVGPIGWGLAWWALGLYWAAAVLYLTQTAALLRADRSSGPGTPPTSPPPSAPPPPPGPAGPASRSGPSILSGPPTSSGPTASPGPSSAPGPVAPGGASAVAG